MCLLLLTANTRERKQKLTLSSFFNINDRKFQLNVHYTYICLCNTTRYVACVQTHSPVVSVHTCTY